MPALTFEQVSHRYAAGGRPALQHVDLTVDEGELVLLVGESGSGKSTLLRAALGLVPRFHGGELHGRVRVGGLDTRRHRPGELARHAGLVFQDPEAQVVSSRVLAEAAFGLENLGVVPAEILPRARAALRMAGAEHLADRTTRTLSGGERQRVAIASVLAMGPRVLLLDEPTSQLDPAAADELVATLLHLRDRHGIAVVIAEHRTERLFDVADRVVAMRAGAITVDTAPAAARAALASEPWLLPRDAAEPPPAAEPVDPAGRLVAAAKRLGPTKALDGVSAAFERGAVTAVTGPNGAGKTTLALALCGLLDLDSGTAAHRGRAGYVAQDPAAYLLHDTVLDEVEYGLGNLGVPAPARRARAEAELDRFDLGWAAAEHPRDLSSGERQRLAVASVTAMRPDLVVLDEPTRGVDGRRKQALTALVRGLAADGAGVVVVSHDAPFVADVATAAVVMAGGRVAAAARPGSEAVHA
ncbi:MAG TPA: ATP-binding cassette domain-containing protein [Gaiellales bacterium]|jgi:energy-coupling factor transport system ATP-binding protein